MFSWSAYMLHPVLNGYFGAVVVRRFTNPFPRSRAKAATVGPHGRLTERVKRRTKGLRLENPFHRCLTTQEFIDPNSAPGGSGSEPQRALKANTQKGASSVGQCLVGPVPSPGGLQEPDAGSGDPANRRARALEPVPVCLGHSIDEAQRYH